MTRRGLIAGAVTLLVCVAVPVRAASIREIPLPRAALPADVAAAPDGSIWISVMHADRLLRFEPDAGRFTEVALPAQTLPRGLVVDPRGHVWFAASARGFVGRVGDARRRPDEFALPSVLRATTAVPSPWSLAFAPRTGQIWFTVHGEGLVGRLPSGAQPTRRGFVVEELALGPGTRPDGIAVDAAGAVWVAGSARDVLVRIDPADGSMRRIPLPAGSHPRGLAADGERGVWAALAGAGSVARVADAGAVTTWRLPTGGHAFPVAVAADGAGGAWIADYGADAIVRWHARARRFETFALPRPGTRVHAIAVDGRGRLWYVGAFGGVLGVVE